MFDSAPGAAGAAELPFAPCIPVLIL